MSPAGSGSGDFRSFASRPRPSGSNCTWLLPWLLPAGLLGAVLLLSLSSALGYLLAGIWGWLVFPYAARFIHARARANPNGNGSCDGESDYWRTKLM
jgi:hypothetical protein